MSEFVYDEPASHLEVGRFIRAVALGGIAVTEREKDFSKPHTGQPVSEFPKVVADLLPGGSGIIGEVRMGHSPHFYAIFSQYATRSFGGGTVGIVTHVKYKIPNGGNGPKRHVESVVLSPEVNRELAAAPLPIDYSQEYDNTERLGKEFGFDHPSKAEMLQVVDYLNMIFPPAIPGSPRPEC